MSERAAPPLPKEVEWHSMTRAWWRAIWLSPMAEQWLPSDRHSLYLLADLVNNYWHKPSVALASEIRQQEGRFGLTPLDRRRLQWASGQPTEEQPVVEPLDELRARRARRAAQK